MLKYLISLELSLQSINFHIICLKETGIVYTLAVRSINNKNTQKTLVNWVLKQDFKNLINFFKTKFDLQHSTITLSYGPLLRQYIKQQPKEDKNG